MRRRAILYGFVSVAALSGCGTKSRDTSENHKVSLGSVGVRNHDDRAHQVHVWIYEKNTKEFEETVEVEAATGDTMGSEVIAKRKFVNERSKYVVEYTVDNGEKRKVNLSNLGETDCYVIVVRIGSEGNISTGIYPNGYECQSSAENNQSSVNTSEQ